MKFTLSWLKEHLDTQASLHEITQKLTDIGLELEGVENPAEALGNFIIAKITSCDPHPDADKLRLLTVHDGKADYKVVCGAANACAGLIGVFAAAGTYVPGLDITLKETKIRGEESCGMMCAEDELGLGEDHGGIIELPGDAPIGMAYALYAGLDDPLIDISVTPNRQDCMGVRGIARDLAAAGLGALKPLHVPKIARSGGAPAIAIEDAAGCPALHSCLVSGVTNNAAPEWMQKRLKSIGQKPISALVDITNYVTIDLGRPLHVYDADKISGTLTARKAKAGETVTALNGKEYVLDESITVLADAHGADDIAGIMGGERTGADENTRRALIECAYFTPENIALAGQKLGLTSDARQRFERGVDPAFLADGMAIATHYLLEICGGSASEVAIAGEAPTDKHLISYDPALCTSLGGAHVDEAEQRDILARLGFDVSADWGISVPTWRRDIDGAPDIVEEIIRIKGLDAIPSTPLPRAEGIAASTLTPAQIMERKLRRASAALGLNEAVNWSFISEKEAAAFGGGDWTLANPISEELKVMRPSLLPGLLSSAKRNLDRGASCVRIFELGRRYFKGKDGYSDEKLTLGLLLAGEKCPRDWQNGKAQGFNAFDAKGLVMQLLEEAGVDCAKLMVMDDAGDHYHPGQSASLRLGPKNVLATLGALHPVTAKAFGLKGAVMAAEIYLDALPSKKGAIARAAYAPPILQSLTRDFAFLLDADLPAGDLVRVVKLADKTNIVEARLFDRFAGEGVPQGKVSLAVEITLQPTGKTYVEEELAAISDKVIAAAAKLGAQLRG